MRLTESLVELCRRFLLEEKILVAPSFLVGQQLAEDATRMGGAWVNLRIATVGSLAWETAGIDLSSEGLGLLTDTQSLLIMEQVCAEVLADGTYFGKLRSSPGLHRALLTTITELRRAGVSSETVQPGWCEDSAKGAELSVLMRRYETLVAACSLLDGAGVIQRALEKATRQEGTFPPDAQFFVPDHLELTGKENELIKILAGERLHLLETDSPDHWKPADKNVRIRRALGEENEVRAIFRDVLSKQLALDQVEIIYTDEAAFLPLIHDLACEHGLLCTFAAGTPVHFSRPGQAIVGWLDWMAADYEVASLLRLLGAGSLDIDKVVGDGISTSGQMMSRILREAGIFWDRHRYISCLESLCKRRTEPAVPDEDGAQAQNPTHAARLANALSTKKFVERLLAATPEPNGDKGPSVAELAKSANEFLSKFARIAGEQDAQALKALQEVCDELASMPMNTSSLAEGIGRLRETVLSVRFGAGRPQPGHIHVSQYRTGGYSSREHVFVVGLDEGHFPGEGLQDPILLDPERDRANQSPRHDALEKLAARPARNTTEFRRCLARLRGVVALSYSCRDLLEDREKFPSAVVLEVYRQTSVRNDADYEQLNAGIGPPAGFVPCEKSWLSESEWWLERLGKAEKADSVVRSAYPWLGHGWTAEAARNSGRFTPYDGRILTQGVSLDPRQNGEPTSASRIEQLAKCPFAYFLRHVLKVDAPDPIERDPLQWLDPGEFGTMLHEVFRAFMAALQKGGRKPVYARDWPSLAAIARDQIQQRRGLIPPPNETAFAAQSENAILTCQNFLKSEEENCRNATPKFFELSFGLDESATGPVSVNPVELHLGRATSFLLRGRIDRLDELGPDEFAVWDYKTGGTYGFKENSHLNAGRQIQHALYAMAAERLLSSAECKARVRRSGYFFPGPKGEGQRIAKNQDVPATRTALKHLFEILNRGIFLHAPDQEFCKYCDFQRVCDGPENALKRAKAKLESADAQNEVLNPIRSLLSDGS